MERKSKVRAILGGPSYLMQVDARHATSMVGLAIELYQSGCRSIEIDYQHACPVEIARNAIFTRAVKSDATHLIWVDSDVYWGGEDNPNIIWGCDWLFKNPAPIICIPVRQRNGHSNIILDDSFNRLQRAEIGRKVFPCWGAGLGMAIFYLPWYREHATSAGWGSEGNPWFRTEWMPIHGERQFISEDIWHTSRLSRIGGQCQYAPLVYSHHLDRGYERGRNE